MLNYSLADIRALLNVVLGSPVAITSATKANPCAIGATAHGLVTGDLAVVKIGGSPVVGTPVSVTGGNRGYPCAITATAHGLVTGDLAVGAGIGGTTTANTVAKVTRVDADHVTLDGVAGVGVYTNGGTISKVAIATPVTAGVFRVTKVDANTVTLDGVNNTAGATFSAGGSIAKVTTGAAQDLKPCQLRSLLDALRRVSHVETGDGTGESRLSDIFPASGQNP